MSLGPTWATSPSPRADWRTFPGMSRRALCQGTVGVSEMLIVCASVAPCLLARYTVWRGRGNQGDAAVRTCAVVESAR